MSTIQHTIINLNGGMQDAIDPALRNEEQYDLGVNVTVRGGIIQTRQALADLGISLSTTEKFQGAFRYDVGNTRQIIYGMAGVIYALNLDTLSITNHGLLLSATCDRLYFSKAEAYLIIQDSDFPETWAAKNWPVIMRITSFVDQSAMPVGERIPKGGPMAYGHGRLFVASPYVVDFNGVPSDHIGAMTGFVASDVYKGNDPDAHLSFTENEYLNTGGQITLPDDIGEIKAMAFAENYQNGQGKGPLVVFAENGCSAFEVNAPRNQWTEIDLGVVKYSGAGCLSPFSILRMNSDLIMRGSDKTIRTLNEASEKYQKGFLNENSISSNVWKTLANDTTVSLEKCSIAKNGARIMTAVLPDLAAGTFSGVLSLDTNNISAISLDTPPVWESIWTGPNVVQLLKGRQGSDDRLFVISDDSDGVRRIYYPLADEVSGGEDASIECWLVTKMLDGKEPRALKTFRYADVWISELKSDATMQIYYKPDRCALWAATGRSVLLHGGGVAENRKPLRFTPTEPVPVVTPQFVRMTSGYMHQFAIKWTGRLRIERIQFFFDTLGMDYDAAKSETRGSAFAANGTTLFDLNFYQYRMGV